MVEAAYDVIVLGSGCAGLSAGVVASELGLSTLVIEKAQKLGGGTTNSYGLLWIGCNHLAAQKGVSDTPQAVFDYMSFLGGGETDADRLDAFIQTAPRAIEFMEACGARFQIVEGVPDHYHGIAPGSSSGGRSLEAQLISGADVGEWQHRMLVSDASPQLVTASEQAAWGGPQNVNNWDADIMRQRKAQDLRGKGLGLATQLLKCLLARKADILTGYEVKRLETKEGRVTGVIGANNEFIEARRGVVIATGGYESNPEFVQNFEGAFPNVYSQAPPSVTGDGLVLGTEVGAAVRKINNNMAMILASKVPGDNGQHRIIQTGIVELFSPHTMVVNKSGARFADETFFQGIVPALREFDVRTHACKNLPCFLIFDQQFAKKYSFGLTEAGKSLPASVSQAASLPELAHKLGVDPSGLMRTAERYNSFVRNGRDDDFHRGESKWRLMKLEDSTANPTLGSISEPPYYGATLGCTITSSVGLLTNADAQVLNLRKRPIPGLYASGVAAARTESGAGYQAGMNLAAGLTFSYRAAQHMRHEVVPAVAARL